MLFQGSKHYWKQRCHVDFTIYWHKSKDIIEIANYNSDAHEEGERIFINVFVQLGLQSSSVL